MEEALYEITSLRQFAQLTLGAPIPEDTTLMNVRHLPEKHPLVAGILAVINATTVELANTRRSYDIVPVKVDELAEQQRIADTKTLKRNTVARYWPVWSLQWPCRSPLRPRPGKRYESVTRSHRPSSPC